MIYISVIIIGIVLLLTSLGLILYYGLCREEMWSLFFFFGCLAGVLLIVFGGKSLENSPKEIEKRHQQHLEKIEQAKKELEHFYIDHPEFKKSEE